MPKQHSNISLEMPPEEEAHTKSKPIFEPPARLDDCSISDGDSHVSENSWTSQQTHASCTNERVNCHSWYKPMQKGSHRHKEWLNLCPNKISMETKECITWLCRLLQVRPMKISFMTPIFNSGEDEEPYIHTRRKDGWHHVSSASTQTANVKEFVQAVIKKVNGHVDCNNWTLQKRSKVPDDVQLIPSVWALRCKHNLTRNKIKSHKARLNLHSGKQVYGMNYFEMYAPVVTWFAIRLLIVFCIIFCWLGWEFQFSVLISWTPIRSGIPIPIQILGFPDRFFFRIPLLKTHQIGILICKIWNSVIISHRK